MITVLGVSKLIMTTVWFTFLQVTEEWHKIGFEGVDSRCMAVTKITDVSKRFHLKQSLKHVALSISLATVP